MAKSSENKKRDQDEIQLAKITKSLLAMPHKVREAFKVAKPRKTAKPKKPKKAN